MYENRVVTMYYFLEGKLNMQTIKVRPRRMWIDMNNWMNLDNSTQLDTDEKIKRTAQDKMNLRTYITAWQPSITFLHFLMSHRAVRWRFGVAVTRWS